MSKKLFVLAAILTFAIIGSTFAAVENIKVSGDINSEAVTRDLSMGGGGTIASGTTRDKDQFLFSQVRLRFDADLTENVSTTVRFINERLWGAEDAADTDIDLDLAYVTMKEFLYQPLTVMVGRQNLCYGNGLIVGDPDTNQTASAAMPQIVNDLSLRKSFDAVRVVLDFAPFTIDGIYAKPFEGTTNIADDVTLFGTNINYKWASFNGVTEGYFFGSHNSQDGVQESFVTTQVPENQSTTYVIGGRFQFDPIEKLTLGLEGAYQTGDLQVPTGTPEYQQSPAAQHLSAFAIQAMAEYRFMTQYNPKLGLVYTYLSGADDWNDRKHASHAWQPMFENQSAAELINVLFPNSNTQCITLRGSMMPREDITLGLSYTWDALAENRSELSGAGLLINGYNPTRGAANGNGYVVTNDSYLGSEVDAYALYDYTEDVQIKLSGAWFIPGDYFAEPNDQTAYSLRAGLKVNF